VLKVTEAVVERQGDFLSYGVSHLRPLVLRDIATAIDMHESTVSRATADKFVATPRGNYPFKYFFSNALPSSDGEGGHAAEAIRQKIKQLIDEEKPDQVLSDDQIVNLLRADGVSIARRTVAKYRESLSIPSSVQRRREACVTRSFTPFSRWFGGGVKRGKEIEWRQYHLIFVCSSPYVAPI